MRSNRGGWRRFNFESGAHVSPDAATNDAHGDALDLLKRMDGRTGVCNLIITSQKVGSATGKRVEHAGCINASLPVIAHLSQGLCSRQEFLEYIYACAQVQVQVISNA